MSNRWFALWGEEKYSEEVSPSLLSLVKDKVGFKREGSIWDGYYNVDDLPISSELSAVLSELISPEHISFDSVDRAKHSFGKGGIDYIRLMENKKARIVDAVVYPDEEEVGKIVRNAGKKFIIIPYGGGTSVTGGLTPEETEKFVVSVDLERLNTLVVDEKNYILEAGAGAKGPEIESMLRKFGLTLGNFPESFDYSTVGGWIGTNATGQESNRYGRARDFVLGLKIETPIGTFSDNIVPGESAFFKLSDIAIGNEGTFGIVTKAWLRLHKIPEKLYFKAYMFKSFSEGLESLMDKFKGGSVPIVSRLSDESETELSMATIEDSAANNIFKKYISFRGYGGQSAILIAMSDKKEDVTFNHGLNLGSIPARYWYRDRFSRPYIYNELLKKGIVADTIETSATWDKLENIHKTTRQKFEETIQSLGIKGTVMCHASHQYVNGSALYFTFIFYSEKEMESNLFTIRDEMIRNIIKNGGSITHHHGIGKFYSQFLKDYKGRTYDLINAVKDFFDPDNSINPGILASNQRGNGT